MVVWACQYLRPYLQLERFKLYIYHPALKWLLTSSDPSGDLVRCLLRLSEFSFTVKFKKSIKNTISGASSRLPTNGKDSSQIDYELPFFSTNYEIAEGNIAEDDDVFEELFALSDLGDSIGHIDILINVTTEHLICTQAKKPCCAKTREELKRVRTTPFLLNDHGLLCRKSHDNRDPIVVPLDLQAKVLQLTHHSKIAGDPGGARMYSTRRRHIYWPSLSLEAYHSVRNCTRCVTSVSETTNRPTI